MAEGAGAAGLARRERLLADGAAHVVAHLAAVGVQPALRAACTVDGCTSVERIDQETAEIRLPALRFYEITKPETLELRVPAAAVSRCLRSIPSAIIKSSEWSEFVYPR